jgi:NADH-ubiquinone oxidoreductase chain 2
LLSLVIGSILGLTQSRIKRLYAYSTISHVGFILLALSITSVESIQSFIFYLLQYSVSNLNAFLILLSIGFSLYLYVYDNKEDKENMIDENNSPIQLINQIKGYFYINSFLSISFAITIFSFIGIPPMIGFFAKQMILSAALDNGYIFMALVAIITSVIGAGYYLNLIKQVFFHISNYRKNTSIENAVLSGYLLLNNYHKNPSNEYQERLKINTENITLNGALSYIISVITLLIALFIFMPEEWFNIISVLTLVQFKA